MVNKNKSLFSIFMVLTLVLQPFQMLIGSVDSFAATKGTLKVVITDDVQSSDVTDQKLEIDYNKIMDGNTTSEFSGSVSPLATILGKPDKTEEYQVDPGNYIFYIGSNTKDLATYNKPEFKGSTQGGTYFNEVLRIDSDTKILGLNNGSQIKSLESLGNILIKEGETTILYIGKNYKYQVSIIQDGDNSNSAPISSSQYTGYNDMNFEFKSKDSGREGLTLIRDGSKINTFFGLKGTYERVYKGDGIYKRSAKEDINVQDGSLNGTITLNRRDAQIPLLIEIQPNDEGKYEVDGKIKYTISSTELGSDITGTIDLKLLNWFLLSESIWKVGGTDVKPIYIERYLIDVPGLKSNKDVTFKLIHPDNYEISSESETYGMSKQYGISEVVKIKLKLKDYKNDTTADSSLYTVGTVKTSSKHIKEDELDILSENMRLEFEEEHDNYKFVKIAELQGKVEENLEPSILTLVRSITSRYTSVPLGKGIFLGSQVPIQVYAESVKNQLPTDRIRNEIIKYFIRNDYNKSLKERKVNLMKDVNAYDFLIAGDQEVKVTWEKFSEALQSDQTGKRPFEIYMTLRGNAPIISYDDDVDNIRYIEERKANYKDPMSLHITLDTEGKLQIITVPAKNTDISDRIVTSMSETSNRTYTRIAKEDIVKIKSVESVIDTIKASKRTVIEGLNSEGNFLFRKLIPNTNEEIFNLIKTPNLEIINIYIKNLPVARVKPEADKEGEMQVEFVLVDETFKGFSDTAYNTPEEFGYYTFSKLESTKGLKVISRLQSDMYKTLLPFKMYAYAGKQSYPVAQFDMTNLIAGSTVSTDNTNKFGYAFEVVSPNAPYGYTRIKDGESFKGENTPGGSGEITPPGDLSPITKSYFDGEFKFDKQSQMQSYFLKKVSVDETEKSVTYTLNNFRESDVVSDGIIEYNSGDKSLGVLLKGIQGETEGTSLKKLKFEVGTSTIDVITKRVILELLDKSTGKTVYRKPLKATTSSDIFSETKIEDVDLDEVIKGKSTKNYAALIYVINTPQFKLTENDEKNKLIFYLTPRVGTIEKKTSKSSYRTDFTEFDIEKGKPMNISMTNFNESMKKYYTPIDLKTVTSNGVTTEEIKLFDQISTTPLNIINQGDKVIISNGMTIITDDSLTPEQQTSLANINMSDGKQDDYLKLGITEFKLENIESYNTGIVIKRNELKRDLKLSEIKTIVSEVNLLDQIQDGFDNKLKKLLIKDNSMLESGLQFKAELVKKKSDGTEEVLQTKDVSINTLIEFEYTNSSNDRLGIRLQPKEGYKYIYKSTYIKVVNADSQEDELTVEGTVEWKVEPTDAIIVFTGDGKTFTVKLDKVDKSKYRIKLPKKTSSGENINYIKTFTSDDVSLIGTFDGNNLIITEGADKGSITKIIKIDTTIDSSNPPKLNILGNGTKVETKVLDKEENIVTFQDLPAKDENGKKIKYTFELENKDNYNVVDNNGTLEVTKVGDKFNLTINISREDGSKGGSVNLIRTYDGKKEVVRVINISETSMVANVKDLEGKVSEYSLEVVKGNISVESLTKIRMLKDDDETVKPKPEGFDEATIKGEIDWKVKDNGINIVIEYLQDGKKKELTLDKTDKYFHMGDAKTVKDMELKIITPSNYSKEIKVHRRVKKFLENGKETFYLQLRVVAAEDEVITFEGTEIKGTVKWKVFNEKIKARLVLYKNGTELETLNLTKDMKDYKFKEVADPNAKYKVEVSILKPVGITREIAIKAKANKYRAHDLIIYIKDKGEDGGNYTITSDNEINEIKEGSDKNDEMTLEPSNHIIKGKLYYTFRNGMPPFKVVLTKISDPKIRLVATFKTQGSRFTFKNLKGNLYKLSLELPEGYIGAIGANGTVFITRAEK